MAFSRQEYWNGLPFPSLGYLPDPGIEPRSPAFQIIFCLRYLGSLPSVPKVIQKKKILKENLKKSYNSHLNIMFRVEFHLGV